VKSKEADQLLLAFGVRVKTIRERQGLTKTQLAFEMGTGEKYIRELELGKINITLKNLHKLAVCLNVNPKQLVDFD
jgi:transcriptional regulator with XRE-family HTH domain